MFKKKKPEPEDVPKSETQELDVTSKDTKKEAPKELTLEEQISLMTEAEYRAIVLNILGEIMEKVKVIENEAIQSRDK